jgi:hypothetical protein
MITWVHALWGDELVANWPKALFDVQYGLWRTKPNVGRTLAFAYGEQNYRWLAYNGLTPTLAHHQAVVDFHGTGDREGDGRGPRGWINYDVSAWQHKHHAIALAFDHGADEVIWLDWDTKFNSNARLAWLDTLRNGPVFQGRMRRYLRRQGRRWRKLIYHGGCYYLRSVAMLNEIERLRQTSPKAREGVLTTLAADVLFFNGSEVPAVNHRRLGLDNPQLYSTARNAVASDTASLFQSASTGRSHTFPCYTGDETKAKSGIPKTRPTVGRI